ncbi:MAG: glycosyltransferase family 4 protein, partial [Mariniphaga sp.]|nr:glycosyltransferase family 4 protein [Mariniphaga sp.]
MKVLYISTPFFFDMDLSLVQSLSENVDLHFLINVPVYAKNATALNLTTQMKNAGIYKASLFPELVEFKNFINPEKTSVIYRTGKKQFVGSNLRLQKEVVKFIKELNPDIIHSNNFLGIEYLLFLIKNRRPLVQTIHDPFPHAGENSYRDFIVRKLNYSFIKKKILLNKTQKESFIKFNKFSANDVFVSSLGPYTYLKHYSKNESVGEDAKILFFGRISLYKGIDYLIKAIEQIQDEIPNIQLTIAGKGKYWFDKTKIERSKHFNIINRHISNIELAELLNQNQIVVCPYIDATQSGVIMTAYAFCKPVIATKVGGLAEMVDNNETGKLVAPRNHKQLANAIKELINTPGLIDEMRSNINKKYFEGSHSWGSLTDELIDIY